MDSNKVVAGLVFGTIFGILVGLVPLIIGVKKKKTGLGVGGFFASAVSGAVMGLILSIPIAGIFTWLAIRNSKSSKNFELSDLGPKH